MNLKEAKKLRDEIGADGTYCTVPLGFGPAGYFCRIITSWKEDCSDVDWGQPARKQDFHSRRQWLSWKKKTDKRNEEIKQEREAAAARRIRPPRNALEMMIDQACGLR